MSTNWWHQTIGINVTFHKVYLTMISSTWLCFSFSLKYSFSHFHLVVTLFTWQLSAEDGSPLHYYQNHYSPRLSEITEAHFFLLKIKRCQKICLRQTRCSAQLHTYLTSSLCKRCSWCCRTCLRDSSYQIWMLVYTFTNDNGLWRVIQSALVCCGYVCGPDLHERIERVFSYIVARHASRPFCLSRRELGAGMQIRHGSFF